jgi:S-adenosylmethionine:tRNA ribosyltransferase-isomerase
LRAIQIQTEEEGLLDSFKLPSRLEARVPPEARGLRRDQVRLLVYERETERLIHSCFDRLPEFLRRGDVLVLNDSRTIPASLQGHIGSNRVEVRLLHAVGNLWLVSVTPSRMVSLGSMLTFDGGLSARTLSYSRYTGLGSLKFEGEGSDVLDEIYSRGRPVQYEHLKGRWALDDFQTVYATHPGSVEMPSAGRPFSWELLFKLRQSGVRLAFVTLHCAVSFLNSHAQSQLPLPEQYFVGAEASEIINDAKKTHRRIIAVGTTVVRALESAMQGDNLLHPRSGWTDLRINSHYQLRIVDSLLTGFHEPDSSHLDMISAFIGSSKLTRLYREAIRKGYYWHEFGDANLIL